MGDNADGHFRWTSTQLKGRSKMKYVLTVVEQLDRAIDELSTDHPINNRLALILIDNATELVLHRRCTDHLYGERLLRRLQPKQRRLANGRYLRDKLKVLEQLGDITGAERRFVNIAHHYRNELYHAGLQHDDITRAISGHYFLLCCDLFARLKPYGISQSSTDRYTAIAKRYLSVRNGWIAFSGLGNRELVEVLAEKLQGARPEQIPDLAETLAESARRAIGDIEDALAFVVRDNPFNLSCATSCGSHSRNLSSGGTLKERELIVRLWTQFTRTKWELLRNSSTPHCHLKDGESKLMPSSVRLIRSSRWTCTNHFEITWHTLRRRSPP